MFFIPAPSVNEAREQLPTGAKPRRERGFFYIP